LKTPITVQTRSRLFFELTTETIKDELFEAKKKQWLSPFPLLRRACTAPSFVVLQLFSCSRLFKVTMIDWLLNDILLGWEKKKASVLLSVFVGTGLGYYNAPPSPTLIFGSFRGNGGTADCYTQQFL